MDSPLFSHYGKLQKVKEGCILLPTFTETKRALASTLTTPTIGA